MERQDSILCVSSSSFLKHTCKASVGHVTLAKCDVPSSHNLSRCRTEIRITRHMRSRENHAFICLLCNLPMLRSRSILQNFSSAARLHEDQMESEKDMHRDDDGDDC